MIEISSNLKSTIDNFIRNPKTPKPTNLKQNNLNEVKKEIKFQRYVLLDKKRGIESLDTKTIEKITNQEPSIERTEVAINNYGDMNILDVVVSSLAEAENFECETNVIIMCNGVELLKEKVSEKDSH